jgi:hypothetical protein
VGYVKNVWVNGDESKPLDQIRMNHVEDGIFVAAATADSAAAVAAAAATLDGVTASMADTGSGLSQAAQGQFPVYRVWDGSAYPTRVSGSLNIFFGPSDPGLAMEEGDYWANPDVTTLDEIISQVEDSSSDLHNAVKETQTVLPVEFFTESSSGLETVALGSSPSRIAGWKLIDTVASVLFANATVPVGWNTARLRFHWTQNVGGTGNVRFFVQMVPNDGTAVGVGSDVLSSHEAPASMVVSSSTIGIVTTPAGGTVSIAFGRLGDSAADTFTGDIVLVSASLERLS